MKLLHNTALSAFILVCLILPVRAGDTFKIDSAHSTIGFGVRHFVGTTSGKFIRFNGTVDLDRDHPERSSVQAQIEVDSIDTQNKKRDNHLRSTDFFDAKKYPQMTFQSRTVKRTGPQSGDIVGDLNLHGVIKPVTLHVKLVSPLTATGPTRWEITTDPLKRRDFGLMFSPGAEAISGIGQDVSIKMQIQTVPSN